MKEESDAPSGVMTREQRGLDQILGVKYFGQRKPEKSAIIERAAWEPGWFSTTWKSTTKRYKWFSFPPIGGHFESAAQIPVDFVSILVLSSLQPHRSDTPVSPGCSSVAGLDLFGYRLFHCLVISQ